jgi:cytochrome c-type biogenesis protein
VLLLFVYGIGLAVPFLAVGLGFTRTLGSFRRIQRRYRAIQAGAGVLLVTMGSLLVTGHLYVLNVYAQRALRAIGLDWWTSL